MKLMKMINEHSAGGAVFRKFKEKTLWLVSKHSGYHKWVLPKGQIEKGEKAEETAVREVLEETGIKAEIVQKIDFLVRYKYIKEEPDENSNTLVDKMVEFYLMKYAGGNIKDHSWEMEEVKWVEYKEAIKLLGFPGEREVLKKARELVK